MSWSIHTYKCLCLYSWFSSHRFCICRFISWLKCICDPRLAIARLPFTLEVCGGQDTWVVCHVRSQLRLHGQQSAILFPLRHISSFLLKAYLVPRVWHFAGFVGDSLCKMAPAGRWNATSVSEHKKAAMRLMEKTRVGQASFRHEGQCFQLWVQTESMLCIKFWSLSRNA